MQRRYDLDWLRVMAFALLMLFHTGMMFSTWDWHVKNIQTSNVFDYVMRWVHAWRMPLLFFISGSAVWFAMDRASTLRFLLERQKRLLLPLVFGMLVVIPPQVYLERLYHQQQYSSFWDFYRTIFTSGSYPEGNLSWHHLWYIPYIWAFSMIMLPLFVAVKSTRGRDALAGALKSLQRPWLLFLLFIPSALVEILLRPHWPYDANNLVTDWANFSHKLTFFIAGFLLASGTALFDCIAANRRKFLIAGIAALAILHPIWVGDRNFSKLMLVGYRMLSNFHIWMWLLAVLGYGRAYLNFNHPFLRYTNEAVYPFYILHQTVIIALAYQLAYVNWPIGLKFPVVATGTFVLCWVLYACAIKPWNLLRVCFGMKWRRVRQEQSTTNSPAGEPMVARAGSVTLLLGFLCLLFVSACSRDGGKIICRTITAPALSRNLMDISLRQQLVVYLPPSYRHTDRRFPVLYFLPNFKCDLWRYTGATFQGFRFEEAMERQLRAGAAKEMIIVMPNTVHFLGGSWYRNSPLTGNWEDYIVQDVVSYIDSNFRTIPSPDSRGLAGHGVGGLGALELGLKHPDVFSCVYAMSPALFDGQGVANLGSVAQQAMRAWEANLARWAQVDDNARRRSFRDYVQSRLNSPNRGLFLEGLFVSYAAAVSSDPRLPYPHVAFPLGQEADDAVVEVRRKLDSGMGGWKEKLQRYSSRGQLLKSITIEYGKHDEYEWIRRGSDYVSALMRQMGIPNELAVHAGGHESTLGVRMETAMLPAVSNSLHQEK